MGVSSLISKMPKQTPNGTNRNWPYSFKLLDTSTMQVWTVSPTGVLTQVTTSFSVDTDLGEVIYPTVGSGLDPLEVADIASVILIRVLPLTQKTDLQTQGSFNADTVEEMDDRDVMIAQQQQEEIGRCLKVDLSEDEGNPDTLMAQLNASVAAAETAEDGAEAAQTAAELAETGAEAAQTAAAASAEAAAAIAALGYIIDEATRDLTAASGDVVYSGLGLTPQALIGFATIESQVGSSWGLADGTDSIAILKIHDGTMGQRSAHIFSLQGPEGSGNRQVGVVKSFAAGQYTITWTKIGTPTGTAYLKVLALP